ncbi:hypothetical protein BST79_gp302 [Only Syngen Nebraska virus 5]|uniref:hypothetical protein n=1 Tax=Only Syngen Nebraska virus 5 TaxID=1917232 RepID=UPI000900C20D|nr:hypothetical protein BST79_gp302 [Only Syngen Nebraska virus 5]APC25815.1 hypothetical protein [Only Syngen Nebraska virus 5]
MDYIIDHSFEDYINTMAQISDLSDKLKCYEDMYGKDRWCMTCGIHTCDGSYYESSCDGSYYESSCDGSYYESSCDGSYYESSCETSCNGHESEPDDQLPEIVSLDYLPDDIIEKLSEYLDSYGDLVSLSFVNKKYNEIFSKHAENKMKEYRELYSSQLKYIKEASNKIDNWGEDGRIMSNLTKLCNLFDIDIPYQRFRISDYCYSIEGKQVSVSYGDIRLHKDEYFLKFRHESNHLKMSSVRLGTNLKFEIYIFRDMWYFYLCDTEEKFPTMKDLIARITQIKKEPEELEESEMNEYEIITDDEHYERIKLYRERKKKKQAYNRIRKSGEHAYVLDDSARMIAIESLMSTEFLKEFSWSNSIFDFQFVL